jgi:hypothetical protein
MGKELLRNYTMPDGEMLTESKTKLEIAKQDFKELQAVEPTLTFAEIVRNIAEVDECINDYSSLESRSSITVATQNLQSIMQNCRDEVQFFFFHCERALFEKATASIEFGRKGVEKARNNPEKMVSLLNLVLTNYSRPEYEEKLDARLTKEYKTKLTNLKTQLVDAIAAQSLAKANRPADTEARIARYNAVWAFARNIGEIGKIAFRGSYAKQQQYTMYDTPTAKKDIAASKKESLSSSQDNVPQSE